MTKDEQIEKLLGALKQEHEASVIWTRDSFAEHVKMNPDCATCKLIQQIEADIATEKPQTVEIVCNDEVHYTRPIYDKIVEEALRTPGYSVRNPITKESRFKYLTNIK